MRWANVEGPEPSSSKLRQMGRLGGTKGSRGGPECQRDFKTKAGASEGFWGQGVMCCVEGFLEMMSFKPVRTCEHDVDYGAVAQTCRFADKSIQEQQLSTSVQQYHTQKGHFSRKNASKWTTRQKIKRLPELNTKHSVRSQQRSLILSDHKYHI